MDLTSECLKELLHYDPETGVFTRLRNSSHAKKGQVAGCRNKVGYLVFWVGGTLYLAHRIAWLYMTGDWPKFEIDHKDGDRANNAIVNLRDVPRAINQQNSRRPRADSSTQVQGVGKVNGRYRARVRTNGVERLIGRFDTPEEASAAYLEAKRLAHEGCTI